MPVLSSFVTKQTDEYSDMQQIGTNKQGKRQSNNYDTTFNTRNSYLLSWLTPYDDRLSKYFNVSGFSCSLGATN